MKLLQNERGSVLTYVLLTILILMIAAPVMLSSLSTNQLANAQTSHNKTANDFALSAMEAFIQYLEGYDTYGRPHDISRLDYFNSYGDGVVSGWGTRTFTTPDGTSVTFSQLAYHETTNQLASIPISDEKRYDVVFTATVNQHSKSVKFNISAFNEGTPAPSPSSSPSETPAATETPAPTPLPETVIIPGQKVPISGKGVIYSISSEYTDSVQNTTIKPAIDGYINSIYSSVTSKINDYLNLSKTPSLQTCTDNQTCTFDKIKTLIAESPDHAPVFIYRPGTLSINGSHTLGSPTKPVILIADNYDVENMDLKVYGSVIANKTTANSTTTGNMSGRNGNKLTTYQSSANAYGDLWVEGANVTGTQTTFTIANTFYAGSLKLVNGADIKAKEFSVNGHMDIQTQSNLQITPGNVSAGSIFVKNNADLTVSSGDLFVSGDFQAETNLKVITGGVVAVAGKITLKNAKDNKDTFLTGTSIPPLTSLQLSGTMPATPSPTATTTAAPSATPSVTPVPSSTVTPTPTPWSPVRR